MTTTDLTPEQQARADEIRERQAAEARPPLARVGDEAPADLGATRDATCSCGATFQQSRLMFDWAPAKCERCRGMAADVQRGEREAAARVRLEALGIPPLYARATLETFELVGSKDERNRQMRLLSFARRYLSDWPDVAAVTVFRGGPGTGKGHVAWAIARELVRLHPIVARVVKLPDVIRDLREAWRTEGGPSEAQRLARYRSADFLVIDEVSRHAFYGEPQRHLYDLVDWRVEQLRPTILTTNEDPAALADLLGPALTSRAAGQEFWEFGTLDFRLRRSAA